MGQPQEKPVDTESQRHSPAVPPVGDDDINNPIGAEPPADSDDVGSDDVGKPIAVVPIEKWVDLGERMVRLEERFGHLSSQVEQLPDKAEANASMQAQKEEIYAYIQSVKEEIYAAIKSLRDDMDAKFLAQDAKFKAQDAKIDKLTESVVRLEENMKHFATKEHVIESEARIMVAIAESKAAAARNNLYLIIAIITLALTIAGSVIALVYNN